MKTFSNIEDLLNGVKTNLFDIRGSNDGSLIKGEYGLLKIYEDVYCFLGLKVDNENDNATHCVPLTWISDRKAYKRTIGKRPLYVKNIFKINKDLYNEENL